MESGIEPMSLALEGVLSTTGPPGESSKLSSCFNILVQEHLKHPFPSLAPPNAKYRGSIPHALVGNLGQDMTFILYKCHCCIH